MKLTISTVALVALAAAGSAAAAGASQDRIPDVQRPTATYAPGITLIGGPDVTLTGCVARGTVADTYTLAETKKEAAAPEAAALPALVTLKGTDVDISKHVGHQVTVTGSYASPDATVGTAGTEKPVAPATTDAKKDTAKTFTVKSLKMVAASC